MLKVDCPHSLTVMALIVLTFIILNPFFILDTFQVQQILVIVSKHKLYYYLLLRFFRLLGKEVYIILLLPFLSQHPVFFLFLFNMKLVYNILLFHPFYDVF